MSQMRRPPRNREPRWLNEDEWLCRSPRHLQPKKLPASSEVCYWGCGTSRPPKASEKPAAPPPAKRVQVTIRETVALYPPPGKADMPDIEWQAIKVPGDKQKPVESVEKGIPLKEIGGGDTGIRTPDRVSPTAPEKQKPVEVARVTQEDIGQPPKWAPLAKMTEAELHKQPLTLLRKYATHGVGVERASKIRGGKNALIPLIMAKRSG